MTLATLSDTNERVLVRSITTILLAPKVLEPKEEILCRGIISFNLHVGWNLISFPIVPVCDNISEIFDSTLSTMYYYDTDESGYISAHTPAQGKAFWLFSFIDKSYKIAGIPVENYTIDLKTGWNMIGTVTAPVDGESVAFDPESYFVGMYRYTSSAYLSATELNPAIGYWVLCLEDTRITVTIP